MRTRTQFQAAIDHCIREQQALCPNCPEGTTPAVERVSGVGARSKLCQPDASLGLATQDGDSIHTNTDKGIEDGAYSSVAVCRCQNCWQSFKLEMTDAFIDYMLEPRETRGTGNVGVILPNLSMSPVIDL